jgi:hypothetical protein
MASRIRFSARLISRGGILVLAEAHIDRVILGQHAAFDQQADRAPAAATGVDIEGLPARR